MGLLDKTDQFRKKLEKLPREALLDIIKEQDEETYDQILRIEKIFREDLRNITWNDGSPVTERPFTQEELALLIDEPFEYSDELAKLGLNMRQQEEFHLMKDAVTFAKNYLNVSLRVYQILMLRHPGRFKILRAGRRLGKSYTLAVLIMHYCYTTKNGRIMVVTPVQAQAKLIFDTVLEILGDAHGSVQEAKVRDVASPPAEINWSNGSSVKFFSTGAKNGSRSDSTRGQEAHIIILDEMDYMGDDDLTAIMAMLLKTQENQAPKKLIAASTPTGKKGIFWEWATNPEHGFKEFWFPSFVNPNYDEEEDALMHRLYRTEAAWNHEVIADWGEQVEGVYPKKYVDRAFHVIGPWDYIPRRTYADSKVVLGVDWDKYGAGSNLVVLEMISPTHPNPMIQGKTKLVYREEVAKGEFTLTNAIKRIHQLHGHFNFDHVYIDRGYGETQMEYLKMSGMEDKASGLGYKVKGIIFNENIEVRDPYTKEKINKQAKAFMVDALYLMLERNQIMFSEEDEALYMQLTSYVVSATSVTGIPRFSMEPSTVPDHAHDALLLAVLALVQNYGDIMKVEYATRSRPISNEVFMPHTEPEEEIKFTSEGGPTRITKTNKLRTRSMSIGGARRQAAPYKRKMF